MDLTSCLRLKLARQSLSTAGALKQALTMYAAEGSGAAMVWSRRTIARS